MARKIVLTSKEISEINRFSSRLKLARQRRRLTQKEMARRAGISLNVYIALEKGGAGQSIAALVKVMHVLGYEGRYCDLLVSDPLGEELEYEHQPQRIKGHSDVADF